MSTLELSNIGGGATGTEVGDSRALDVNVVSGGGGASPVNISEVGGEAFVLGQALADSSLPVVLTAIQAAALSTRGATSSVTSVNDMASSTTLLASNANRLKYTVFNNSTEILYLKEGTAASLTDFTVAIPPLSQYGFYENSSYTGRVDGIWANNSTGAALITEITP